jgi:Lon protease-like protein
MFPLGMVVFPHQVVGLCVFESRYQQLLVDVADSLRFGTCLIARGCEVGGGDERTFVGTMLNIRGQQRMSDGKILVVAEGVSCFAIEGWLDDQPYPRAIAQERCCDDVMIDPDLLRLAETSVRALRHLQSEVAADEVFATNCSMAEDPWVRSWQLCSMTPMALLDQLKVISLSDPNERLSLLVEICCERYGDYQRMLEVDDYTPYG